MRAVLLVLVLSLAGLLGGMVIGLALRPAPEAVPMSAPADRMAPPPSPDRPDLAALEAEATRLRQAADAEQARLDRVTGARAAAEAEQQARLDALARARTAAEAQLAALQRDIAAAQRDLAAQREAAASAPRREAASPPPPSVAQPLPSPASPPPARPAPPPRIEAPPRQEAASGQPRVVLHYRAGSGNGAEAANTLLGSLREGGFDAQEARAASAVPSQRVVRYFHAEDAPAAARLAGRLGRGWAIQDFRGYEPSPSNGTLEVWLPDR